MKNFPGNSAECACSYVLREYLLPVVHAHRHNIYVTTVYYVCQNFSSPENTYIYTCTRMQACIFFITVRPQTHTCHTFSFFASCVCVCAVSCAQTSLKHLYTQMHMFSHSNISLHVCLGVQYHPPQLLQPPPSRRTHCFNCARGSRALQAVGGVSIQRKPLCVHVCIRIWWKTCAVVTDPELYKTSLKNLVAMKAAMRYFSGHIYIYIYIYIYMYIIYRHKHQRKHNLTYAQ
jgi:hypothetical protein